MNQTPAIPSTDLDEFGLLPNKAKAETLAWLDILTEFDRAACKASALDNLSQQYLGVVKVTKSTLYRKRAEFGSEGWRGLVNRSLLKGRQTDRGLPEEFIQFWQGLCLDYQRKTSAAYRSLFLDILQVGKMIPGYHGSWETIWRTERPGWRMPPICPYNPDRLTPNGWTSRNLYRYAPDKFMLAAARIGTGEASRYLPRVPTTRKGLRIGQFKMIDDVWHDHKVNFAGNREAYRPLQLGSLDLFTGFYESYGCKPIRELGPNEKEHIRKHYLRALYVHMFCVMGYHPEGCTILGEHGTAGGDDAALKALQRFAPEITFAAGGMQNLPICKGLFDATPRGNFKWKAALESAHNLHHNELAALPGQVGRNRDNSPVQLYGMDKENAALIKVCVALEEARPDLARELAMPFMQFDRFMEFLHLAYERINHRMDHRLEGFEESGLTVQEYRLDPSMDWLPMSQLDGMAPQARAALETVLESNPRDLVNCRRMSPAEAYDSHKHELRRLSISVAPDILGDEFAHKARVNERGEIVISDPDYKSRKHVFSAQVKSTSGDVVPLARGREVTVHLLSPMDLSFAFVSDPDGGFIGAAPAFVRGARDDMETLQRNLGLRQQALATEIRKLRPHANAKLRERDEAARHNLEQLGVDDPVEERDRREEATKAAAAATRGTRTSNDLDAFSPTETAAVEQDQDDGIDRIF